MFIAHAAKNKLMMIGVISTILVVRILITGYHHGPANRRGVKTAHENGVHMREYLESDSKSVRAFHASEEIPSISGC